jgi:hypothetical protein
MIFPADEKPDLYCDVDGVILYDRVVNTWLIEFIRRNRDMFGNLYWLSCWTSNGKSEELDKRLPQVLALGKVEALLWKELKTEAIDWSRPFIWIEDGVLDEEKKVFLERAVSGQQIWEIRPGEWAELHMERGKQMKGQANGDSKV